MITIKTKNENYTGVIAGITFVNGEAKVEKLSDIDKKWFESYGHEVIQEEIENVNSIININPIIVEETDENEDKEETLVVENKDRGKNKKNKE